MSNDCKCVGHNPDAPAATDELAQLHAENERLRTEVERLLQGWSSLDFFIVLFDCYYSELQKGEVSRVTERKFQEARAELAAVRGWYRVRQPFARD